MSIPSDFPPTEMLTGVLWRHLLAGGVAGAVSRTCTAPLDRLKVFLQVHPEYKSLRSCIRDMVKEGGIRGLWRGNGINILKTVPDTAMKFMVYEHIKIMIRNHKGNEITINDRIVAGSAAGVISQTIIYPLEVLKTRLTLRRTGQYSGVMDAALKICRREGFPCYYRGYVPNLLGIIPYAGIDLAVYETARNYFIRRHVNSEMPGVVVLGGCAALSSTCGQAVSYPLALVRVRLQAQEVQNSAERDKRVTMLGLFRTILEKEGIFGLYRGLLSNIMKVVPSVSISYAVNEKCRQALGVNAT